MEEIRAEIQATKTRLEELQRKQNTLLELQKKELEKGVPLVVPIYDIYKELVYCKKSSYDETTLTLKKGDRAIIEICLWGNQDGTDLDFKFDLTPLGIQYSETNSTDDGGAYRVKPWFYEPSSLVYRQILGRDRG